MCPPRRPWRTPVLAEGGRVEEHTDSTLEVAERFRVEDLPGSDHVHRARRRPVPQRREMVNVTALVGYLLGTPYHRKRGRVRIGPVLVDGHSAAVPDQAGGSGGLIWHQAKDSPTLPEDHSNIVACM